MVSEEWERRVVRAFGSPPVSEWLAKNPPTDEEGMIRSSRNMGQEWLAFLIWYVAVNCPKELVNKGFALAAAERVKSFAAAG